MKISRTSSSAIVRECQFNFNAMYVCMYVCMYVRLKQLTNRNIDNTDNKRCISMLHLFNHRSIFAQLDFCTNLSYLKIVCIRCLQLTLHINWVRSHY